MLCLFLCLSLVLCIPCCHVLVCWKSLIHLRTLLSLQEIPAFPDTTLIISLPVRVFDLFCCLLTALHLPVPVHFLILPPSSIQPSNLFCPELPEREMCSLSGLYPFSSPSSHHSRSSCHFTLLLQTLPHPPFIYLLETLLCQSIPSRPLTVDI